MSKTVSADNYISQLEINGLKGRVLDLPAPKKYQQRFILFIYGHHATLERNFGLNLAVNKYGRVVMPDLPGFGGMDSFYKIGKKPTLDNYADYLADFLKVYYPKGKFMVFGFSFGFLVVTRLLQRHPELVNRVDIHVSLAGLVNHKSFKFPRRIILLYKLIITGMKTRPGAWLYRRIILQSWLVKLFYDKTYSAKAKFKGLDPVRRRQMLEVEMHLWHCNDLRTRAFTGQIMLTTNITDQQVALPVYHIAPKVDQYLDLKQTAQDLKAVYSKLHWLEVDLPNHAPTVIATTDEADGLLPAKLRQVLAKPAGRTKT